MKNIIKISIVILVLLVSNKADAQTYSLDISSSTQITALQNNPDQFKHFTSQASMSNTTRNVSTSNNVYIQQIGVNNQIIANTQSLYSDVGLFQNGNSNEVLLDIKAAAISENVVQQGVNNSVIDINTNGSIFHTTAVYQKGANQNLIMLGSNSISNSMIITMQGKNQTILVRNIKN